MRNEVVIITGSTKGIGLSLAKELLRKGAAVVINGRNEKRLNGIVNELIKVDNKVIGVSGDVSNPATGKKLIESALKVFGKVSILVNNAGMIRDQFAYKMTDEEFTDVIAAHVNGNFFCTKPFINHLKEQGSSGHIINFISKSGLLGNVGQTNYSAAKAAVNGMTLTLAHELKRDNIIVNGIAPVALTDMTRPYVDTAIELAKKKGQQLDPAWDIGSSEDVARFVSFILEKKDSNWTGKVFGVNGKNITEWNPPSEKKFRIIEFDE